MSAPRTASVRRGVTLVELLVALVLGTLVLGLAVDLVVRQQRAVGVLHARRLAREQLRAGAEIAAHTLRGATLDTLAPEGSDLRAVVDTALEVRATIGAAVACRAVGSTLELLPRAAAGAASAWALTGWISPPRPGDLALIHDAGTVDAPRDAWVAREVVSLATAATACAGSPLHAAVGGAAVGGWRLELAPGPALAVSGGTPVRFLRLRRLSLYRDGTGSWQLGVRERDADGWSTTQPVAGPLRAPGGPTTGMAARRVGDGGTIEVVLRALPVGILDARRRGDSVTVVVTPRGW